MATMQEINELRTRVQQLVTLGIRDVTDLMRALADEPPETVAQVLSEVMPTVTDPYAAAIGDLATDAYLADRAGQGVRTPYRSPGTPVVPDPGRVVALTKWSAAPLFWPEPDVDLATSRLVGGTSALLGKVQMDTTWNLAAADPVPTGFQRIAQAGSCAFCAMLASRGGVYRDRDAAEGIVGRGVPVEVTKGKQGGQGQGIHARGTRSTGEAYHDHCRCVAVAVHKGNRLELDRTAQEHFNAYWEAARTVEAGLERNVTEWQDPDGMRHMSREYINDEGDTVEHDARARLVVAEMRKLLGTH